MIKIYLFLILLFAVTPVLAQTSDLDDLPLPVLKQKLAASDNDTSRVQLQLALGRLILYKAGAGKKEIDSALSLASQAAILSRRLNYNNGVINAMLFSAESYYRKPDKEKGFKIAQQALAFSQKSNNNEGMARSYIIMGQRYNFDDPVARIAYNDKAIEIFRKTRNLRSLANTLTLNAELLNLGGKQTDAIKLLFEILNMGDAVSPKTVKDIYWLISRTSGELGDYTNGLKYNLLALKTAGELNDTTLRLCAIYHNTAVTYVQLLDYHRAIPYSIKALEIAKRYRDNDHIVTVAVLLSNSYTRTNRLALALALLKEVKGLAVDDSDRMSIAANFLNNLTYAKQLKKADTYAKEIRALLVKMLPNESFTVMNAYHYLANYYLATGQLELASSYTQLYTELAKKKHIPNSIRMAENRFYKIDSIKGNYRSAMNHYQRAQTIKDSIDNVTKAYQISLLNIENETEQKINHIDTLTKQAEIRDQQLKRNQIVQNAIITGAVLLLIITGLIYSRYRLKQRSNAQLMLQKSEIDQQNISLQHLVNDKNQLIGDKDELLHEKDLLLKEVNHRVKNNLQIVMSLLSSQSGFMQNKKAQVAIMESQNRVQAIALIHDQLYSTEKISEIGIVAYIQALVRSLDGSINKKRHQVSIKCIIDDITLDVSQAIPVGIIMNESVTNALKYAFPGTRTGEIVVKVGQIGPQIQMQISDNGVGLPEDLDLSQTNSLGMTLIRGLTSQLKGKYNIDNRAGVSITVGFRKETTASMGTEVG